MSSQPFYPVITSKEAQKHLVKIKTDHQEVLINLQLHREKMEQLKLIKEQEAKEKESLKMQENEQKHKQHLEKMKLEHEQKIKENEHHLKEKELSIKQQALGAED